MTSPWKVLDEYDEELHGEPEKTPLPAHRHAAMWLTLLVAVTIIAAASMLL